MREVKALIKFSMGPEDRKRYLKPSRIHYINSGDNNDDSDVTEGVNKNFRVSTESVKVN